MYITTGKAFKPNPNSLRKSHNGASRCTPAKFCFSAVHTCFRAFLKALWLFMLIIFVSNFQVCNGSPRGQQQGRLRPDQAAPHACDEKISLHRVSRFLNPCAYPPPGGCSALRAVRPLPELHRISAQKQCLRSSAPLPLPAPSFTVASAFLSHSANRLPCDLLSWWTLQCWKTAHRLGITLRMKKYTAHSLGWQIRRKKHTVLKCSHNFGRVLVSMTKEPFERIFNLFTDCSN